MIQKVNSLSSNVYTSHGEILKNFFFLNMLNSLIIEVYLIRRDTTQNHVGDQNPHMILSRRYDQPRLAPMWQQSGTLLFCSCHGIAGFLVDELQI